MKNITQSFKVIALALLLSFGLSYVYAWTAPTVTPPGGNVEAPVNTSATSQYKSGALGVGGIIHGYSNAYFDGNVGVGTAAPTADLHVYTHAAGRAMLRLEATSENAYLVLDRTGDTATMVNKNDGTLRINHSGNSTDAHLVILNSGNVGVGTTTPAYKLEVLGAIAASVANLTSRIGFIIQSSYGQALIMSGGGHGSGMGFYTDSVSAGGPPDAKMVIQTGTGNVGIGTAVPAQKLSVAGTIESTSGGVKFPDGSVQTTASTGGLSGTWHIGGHALATSYTNSTGKTIIVSVVTNNTNLNGANETDGFVGGVLVSSNSGYGYGSYTSVTLIVPPGVAYQVNTGGGYAAASTLRTWAEFY